MWIIQAGSSTHWHAMLKLHMQMAALASAVRHLRRCRTLQTHEAGASVETIITQVHVHATRAQAQLIVATLIPFCSGSLNMAVSVGMPLATCCSSSQRLMQRSTSAHLQSGTQQQTFTNYGLAVPSIQAGICALGSLASRHPVGTAMF